MAKLSRLRALLSVFVSCSASSGCRPAPSRPPAAVAVEPPPPALPATGDSVDPEILSAHLEAVDVPELERQDALGIVFSGELDATSLLPSSFMVMFADGSRVVPTEARLAPASENDENRTVVLIGRFGDPESKPPTDVMVVGGIHGELGESFEGLVATVEPFDARGRVVFAHRVTVGDGVCEGSKQAVRTYWTDGLRGVEAADLAAFEVTLADGSEIAPLAFDDHDLDEQSREDNVLDLCITKSSPAQSVKVDAGVFEDRSGHPSDAVGVRIRRRGP